MKKVVFTIQMVVLMAAFPVYLIVELKQRTGSIPVNDPPSEYIEKPGRNNIQPVLNPDTEELSSSVIRINGYHLKQQRLRGFVPKADAK